jgi:hypothetical protein
LKEAEGDVHSQRADNACPAASAKPFFTHFPDGRPVSQSAVKSPRIQQMLLKEHMHKQGWLTIEETFYHVHDIYIRKTHSGTYKMLKEFEKAKNARNYPLQQRTTIEKETGWTFHPQYPGWMKRTRPLPYT